MLPRLCMQVPLSKRKTATLSITPCVLPWPLARNLCPPLGAMLNSALEAFLKMKIAQPIYTEKKSLCNTVQRPPAPHTYVYSLCKKASGNRRTNEVMRCPCDDRDCQFRAVPHVITRLPSLHVVTPWRQRRLALRRPASRLWGSHLHVDPRKCSLKHR